MYLRSIYIHKDYKDKYDALKKELEQLENSSPSKIAMLQESIELDFSIKAGKQILAEFNIPDIVSKTMQEWILKYDKIQKQIKRYEEKETFLYHQLVEIEDICEARREEQRQRNEERRKFEEYLKNYK